MLFLCPCCGRTHDKPILVPHVKLGLISYANQIVSAPNRVAELLKILQDRGPATASQLALRLLNNPEATPLTYVYITQLRAVLRELGVGVTQIDGKYELQLPR